MILQVVGGLKALASYAALILVLLGVMWLIYGCHEANRRGSWRKLTGVDDWDFDVTKFLRILTLCGFAVGIFSMIIGFAGLILNVAPSIAYIHTTGSESRHIATSVLLIVLGILTFMKPLNDLPIASIIGLLVASAVCIILAFLIPDSAVELMAGYVNPKIVLIVVFFIIFTIIAITIKFYTAGLMFVSKIISWAPIAFCIAIFCIIQGFALLVAGVSIIG